MLWVSFILGLNFISLCFGVWQWLIMSLKQNEIKFKPGIKLLNHNIYTEIHTDGANDRGERTYL